MTLLAESTPALTGNFMLQFLLAVMLLLQIASIIAGFLRGREAKRRSISFEGVPVDKSEFDRALAANKQEHENIFSRMGGAERGLRAEIKADTLRIEEKLSTVDRKVAALQTSNDQQNTHLAEMREAVREIPGELIATLKNTGAIK